MRARLSMELLFVVLLVGSCAGSLLLEPQLSEPAAAVFQAASRRQLLEEKDDGGAREDKEERCNSALDAHKFAMQASKPNIEDGEAEEMSAELRAFLIQVRSSSSSTRQLSTLPVFNDLPYAGWANEIFQWVLSNNLAMPSSQSGEMMYVANKWMDDIALLPSNVSDLGETAYLLWAQRWYDYADRVLQQSMTQSDVASKRGMLMRMLNYYFAAFYPLPTAEQSGYRTRMAEDVFQASMALFTGYRTVYFNVTFNNGTHDTVLPAVFMTTAPGSRLPVIIHTTSPHNWKEMLFLRYGPGAMRRDYSVVFFDGPGMGQVVRSAPHMPVYANFTRVVASVLDAMWDHDEIVSSVDKNQVVLMGASIGGYLTAQACAGLSDQLAACILNPGFVDLANVYNRIVASTLYKDIVTVASISPSSLPSEELAQKFLNPVENILLPIVQLCDEDSDAPELLAEAFRTDVLSPTFVHMAIGFLGANPDELDLDEVPGLMWATLRRINNQFGGYPVEDINVPVMALVGLLDGLAGDQATVMFNRLPKGSRSMSHLQIFDVASGGAMPSQMGAFALYDETVYPWLKTVLAANNI